MNELSLFTGAGGGVLGAKLLGHRIIGYVEFNKYCQKVIKQRITDGFLDAAPIFGDIRKFISDGYAASYTGLVDVLTAGFPCQPFSVAGQQRGADDPRNMWPATIECIRIIRPRIAFLENVPGLLTNEYIRTIFGDLAEAGYHARWCVLGADDCGCCHRRKRVWIVANSRREYGERVAQRREFKEQIFSQENASLFERPIGNDESWVDTNATDAGIKNMRESEVCSLPDSTHERLQGSIETIREEGQESHDELLHGCGGEWSEPWFEVATRLCRVDDAVASRVDRLKALGNGQVPRVVAAAFKILTRDLIC